MVAGARISLLSLLATALLAGCGGGDSIPADDAEVLLDRLAEVEGAVAEGNCDGATESAALLSDQVGDGPQSRVPRSVDPDVRETLREGAARLVQLVEEQCEEPEEPVEPEEEVEPVEPVEPVPTPPVEPEPTPPPAEDDDGDEGPSQGGGRGGGDGSEPSGGVGE